MPVTFLAGASRDHLALEPWLALEIELLEYFWKVEKLNPGLKIFARVDPYGDTEFEHEQLPAVRSHLARLATYLKGRPWATKDAPAPPEYVGFESGPTPCGLEGVLVFLDRLDQLLLHAERRALNVFAIGD
jgi:hypothetical protein